MDLVLQLQFHKTDWTFYECASTNFTNQGNYVIFFNYILRYEFSNELTTVLFSASGSMWLVFYLFKRSYILVQYVFCN